MYPSSRCTKCCTSRFPHPTISRRRPSTWVHPDRLLFWVSGFLVVVFLSCFSFWFGCVFCVVFCFSPNAESEYKISVLGDDGRASQSIPFTHQMGSPEVLDTTSHTGTNPAPPPHPHPLGLCQQVSPASRHRLCFPEEPSQKAELPTWPVRREIELA